MRVELKIGSDIFREWARININLHLNSIASDFTLEAKITEQNSKVFNVIKPTECEVWLVDEAKGINEKLITGLIMNVGRATQKVPTLATITGMSKAGILIKESMPPELYPLQYVKVSLAEIARGICNHYNLALNIHPGAVNDANKIYDNVECKPSESIYNFLARISRERGITISHTNEGDLFIYKIVNITEASSTITQEDMHIRMGVAPDGQEVHSRCMAIKGSDIEFDRIEGSSRSDTGIRQAIVNSPFLPSITISKTDPNNKDRKITKQIQTTRTVVAEETEGENLNSLAEQELAMEARAFPINIDKQGWDFDGRIVRAGFYLMVEAPDLLLKMTKMVVEHMNFSKDGNSTEFLSFSTVLPCVYTGKLPSESPFKNV